MDMHFVPLFTKYNTKESKLAQFECHLFHITMTDNKINSTYFPHKALPKVYGEPTFKHIYDSTHVLLKQNASSIPMSLTGGNHGILALLLDHIEYKALVTEQEWLKPDHPGPPTTYY